MKKVISFIIFILIILAAGFYYISVHQKESDPINTEPAPMETSSLMKHFKDVHGDFSFDYNPAFSVEADENPTLTTDWRLNATEKGILLATVFVQRTYMPGTNFSEAKLTVGRSSDLNNSCLTANTANNEKIAGSATISDFPFTKFISNDAGAGNFYETTSYRGMLVGDCYAIEYTIHSTNIGNYSPDQGIKEFDKSTIEGELEKTVKSFRSLIDVD